MLYEAAVAAGMRRGLSREEAKPVSLSILRATLANDPRLAKPSAPGTCAVCGQPDANKPLLPFMTGRAGVFTWLHPGECHREHQARQAMAIDKCIARARVE
ncbi:hypothetical protein [Ancylobacter sp. TS-1]|uniref:hypothetical protein n=1 Tax=Ancylobacter sp. TS-1 TaxID=1850374 RepID=UPI001265B5A8|nr:hypothetical protein [Ancylobacter sp. TS-1]QFR34701.1 hypothetical protein GBB76_17215 [Ancylobacter sp. TS-1]